MDKSQIDAERFNAEEREAELRDALEQERRLKGAQETCVHGNHLASCPRCRYDASRHDNHILNSRCVHGTPIHTHICRQCAEVARMARTQSAPRPLALQEMFPLAIAEVTKVAEFGAEKYKERGLAEEGFEIDVHEYSGHACDHWAEWRFNSAPLDPETRLHNLAHAIVRLTAILNQELKDAPNS